MQEGRALIVVVPIGTALFESALFESSSKLNSTELILDAREYNDIVYKVH